MVPTDARLIRLRLLFILAVVLPILMIAHPGAAQEPVVPPVPPDGEAGLELFETRCANCHGPTGAGDGELAPNMVTPPQAFTDPAYRRTAEPQAMFDQITNGDLTVGMPPFGPASSNPIPEDGRWNLVATVYSLATPPEAIEQGRQVYEASCAACHGGSGQGDGPDAAGLPVPPADLTQLDYWFNRSNVTVFNTLTPGAIAAHDYALSEDDLWAVVDYARTFSYDYVDPQVLTQPIATGVVSGQVLNGTTGAAHSNVPVSLRAFTPDFSEAMTLTTTLGTDGSFHFDVTNVPPNWVYIASAPYGDLNFNSNIGQLSAANPALDLPITVFDITTDPAAVSVSQLHTVLEFIDDNRVRVNELYIFNNDGDTVFIGESGDPAQGTVGITLPAGAENVSFQRSFGSLDSFLPATDLIQTATGWADRLPIRPGPGALTLLARYELPYESGMTIAHPLNYPTAAGTIILPDAGVKVSGNDWTDEGPQRFETGEVFLNYSHPALAEGEAIRIELDGRPRLVSGTEGTTANRNQTAELVVGTLSLLLMAGAGLYLYRSWQARPVVAVDSPVVADSTALLRAIADLDDAYDAGQLSAADYQRQRAMLKQQVAAVWEKQ